MNTKFSKEWILRKAQEEQGFEVVAGSRTPQQASLRTYAPEDETVEHCAFSALVEFMRRDRRLTIEELAAQARVEPAELIGIERDVRFVPKPRSVHQLAKFFGLPERKLMELSNLTTTHTAEMQEAAVRFAANAKKVLDLDREEQRALKEFVSFLSSR